MKSVTGAPFWRRRTESVSKVEIREAVSRADFEAFIEAAHRANAGSKHYVPLLRDEMHWAFDKKKSPLVKENDVRAFVAFRDGAPLISGTGSRPSRCARRQPRRPRPVRTSDAAALPEPDPDAERIVPCTDYLPATPSFGPGGPPVVSTAA